MANDKMRSGPRGSSDQDAKFGYVVTEFQFDSAADTTYVMPLPFNTTCAVVGVESFALTNTLVKSDDDSSLQIGHTDDANAFGSFDHGAATAGDFYTYTPGTVDVFAAANLIDANTDFKIAYVASSGSNANAGAVVVRVAFQAISGGLYEG